MKKLLKIARTYFTLAISPLFANTQETQDLEVTQPIQNALLDTNISKLESSFSGYRQKDYRVLNLSIPYVKLF